jgi:hypothetical protein
MHIVPELDGMAQAQFLGLGVKGRPVRPIANDSAGDWETGSM